MARPATDGINSGLLLALLGSVLLHLGVLFGLPAKPVSQPHSSPPVEARLISVAPAASPAATPAQPSPTPLVPVTAHTDVAVAPVYPVVREVNAADAPAPPAPPSESSLAPQPAIADSKSDPADSTTYYPVEQLDEPPRPLGDLQLIYPPRARRDGIEGYATLSLLINEHGEVDEIHVVKSQPAGFFEESAIAMLRGQRFTPAIKQGKAAKSRWQKTVRFVFQG